MTEQASVLVGVSGGIAAYKTAMVVSQLVQSGHSVQVVLTRSALSFVQPATFAALSGRPVACELFDPRFPLGAHIELARQSKLLCIAPASANLLSKTATGLADDLLSTLYLCFQGQVLMAPAMNVEMWRHPAVQRNVSRLVDDGVTMIGPDAGWLSCREEGAGRLASPEEIVRTIRDTLSSAAN